MTGDLYPALKFRAAVLPTYNSSMKHGRNQSGFHHVLLLIASVLVISIGFVGLRVFSSKSDTKSSGVAGGDQEVTWQPTDKEWTHSGTLPACPSPLPTPVDLNKATALLYPGQYRGGDYKPHGGFRFDKNTSNSVSVMAPMDAEVVRGAHYTLNGEDQYVFDFIAPCGYMYRFGHMLTLSPKLASIANKLPKNGEGDSRDTPVNPRVSFKAGESIATAVGIIKGDRNTINVFVDWGMYDLRVKNQASQNADWAAKHPNGTEQHAICWFDLLSAQEEAQVRALPPADPGSGTNSDYCK